MIGGMTLRKAAALRGVEAEPVFFVEIDRLWNRNLRLLRIPYDTAQNLSTYRILPVAFCA